MMLSDVDIKKAVIAGRITLTPFDEKRLQPASYDILLANTFVINDPHSTTNIDPVKKIFPKTREVVVPDDGIFVLHPGVSILGYSKDYFGSDDYLIEVNGKSSLARIGLLVHNSAALINPGHFLNVALELCNLNNVPIILRPNMAIAQLTFSELSSPPKQNYKETGRYSTDNIKGYVPPKKKK
ncbi:MAG TPA: dCTP deaminase [Candidatus Paceibacterota bacterium]|uniref:dCTP deaminase n=1 Tax=Candidatus Adlerbacteria bacterium RIFCSPLOWO2_01_FULL_51_16 TaxID=1797243 RepID=A0A1F4XHE5_9BACT|nr:MAG: dCTP deaminase [Candidatus Adlerbacteria bacterium RIFCSPLOWO2_01_FULL_51_16]HXK31371.1 dCTP deaminase [Candidatus Paceibacterota bacterium]